MKNNEVDFEFLLYEGMIVNEDTGEIITPETYHEQFSEEMKSLISSYFQSCEAVNQRPQFEYRRIKNIDTACVPVKVKYHFNKVFRVDMKKFTNSDNLTKDEIYAWHYLTTHVSFPNNDVIFNNSYMTIEEIAKSMRIGRNTLAKALKTLEQRQAIRLITRHKQPPIIYINPFLVATGRVVSLETYMMFKDTVYSPKDYLDDVDE